MKKALIICLLLFTIIGGIILTKATNQVVKKSEVASLSTNTLIDKLKF